MRPKTLTETDDTELAEIVAEIGERLRRGESVRPEDYHKHAETLRDLLPDDQDDGRLARLGNPPERSGPPG